MNTLTDLFSQYETAIMTGELNVNLGISSTVTGKTNITLKVSYTGEPETDVYTLTSCSGFRTFTLTVKTGTKKVKHEISKETFSNMREEMKMFLGITLQF